MGALRLATGSYRSTLAPAGSEVVGACGAPVRVHRAQERPAMKRSPDVKNAMLRMYSAYSAGDVAALLELSSREAGILAIGTDPEEWWEGYDLIAGVTEAFFPEVGGTVELISGDLSAFEEGTVGWAADNGKLRLPDGREVPIRITVVFHLEGGAWKIVQQHSSIGVSNAVLFG